MAKISNKSKRNPFSSDYKPYGVNKGPRGNPQQWKNAYDERMSAAEANTILGDDDAFAILGIAATDVWTEVVKAFRAMVFKVHPDYGGNQKDFERVKAAYSKLSDDIPH